MRYISTTTSSASLYLLFLIFGHLPGFSQTGTGAEPIRYLGGVYVDQDVHDGRLRPAVGVESYQVLRVNRTHADVGDGFGWTYAHAPMLAYWKGKFYLEYLSNPIGEHEPPGQTLVMTSVDGRHWSMPQVVFPPYKPPEGVEAPMPPKSTGYMMHQRMGFYVAPNGRLLVSAFYGHAPNPFGRGGIGRVVREIHEGGSFGPIHFIRHNAGTLWNEANTAYPLYTRSSDQGFREACEALLANKLMIEQWRDEDREAKLAMPGRCSSLSFFHRADGKVVGVCKNALTAISEDEGNSWSEAVRAPTLITNNAKVWGERTADGAYALVYNPVHFGSHRWPLAVSTSRDGTIFDTLNIVNGEVAPRRFLGRAKDFGTQYIRGIAEGNGDPGDKAMWLTYSMNKEDIWVSRVPVPIRDRVDNPVNDNFDGMKTGGQIVDWNVYSPRWAAVSVAALPSTSDKSLELKDKDPYDYARAVRVFPESKAATVRCKVMPKQKGADGLELEITDRYGNRPVRVAFANDGWIKATNGSAAARLQTYKENTWYELEIAVNIKGASDSHYAVSINGKLVLAEADLAEAVLSVERLSIRTGPYRNEPTRRLDRYDPKLKDLPDADEPVAEAVYYVDAVSVVPR
jgi:hypothetical protein